MAETRRQFIRTTGLAATGICMGTITMTQGCSPFTYAEYVQESDRIVVSKNQFGENPYLVIKMKNLSKPVYIGKLDENRYSVLYLECTHKRCAVRPQGTYLKCPCHGSEYDNLGNVTESPAEKNLKTFRFDHDEENIYIY